MARKMRQWIVPIEVTYEGYITVDARTEDEAREKADRKEGISDWERHFMGNAMTTDWGVTGEPELDE